VSPVKKAGHLPIFNRIGVLRAERRMSRAQLADRVGVNVQSIGSLERGDNYPSLDLAFRICEVFGLPVEAVFSRHEFGAMSTQLYRATESQEKRGHHERPEHRDSRVVET
jgi:DNA-binding XRE family transcriptional regulator